LIRVIKSFGSGLSYLNITIKFSKNNFRPIFLWNKSLPYGEKVFTILHNVNSRSIGSGSCPQRPEPTKMDWLRNRHSVTETLFALKIIFQETRGGYESILTQLTQQEVPSFLLRRPVTQEPPTFDDFLHSSFLLQDLSMRPKIN
jgi:hypothetical protein